MVTTTAAATTTNRRTNKTTATNATTTTTTTSSCGGGDNADAVATSSSHSNCNSDYRPGESISSSSSSSSSSRPPAAPRRRFNTTTTTKTTTTTTMMMIYRIGWGMYLVSSFVAISLGVRENRTGRKYTPVAKGVTIEGIQHYCADNNDDRTTNNNNYRLFVNVMAAHPDEAGAVAVCCDHYAVATTTTRAAVMPSSAGGDGDDVEDEEESPLCTFKAQAWPLTNRLSRFPDAILLPILPLLLPLVVRLTTSAVVRAVAEGRWRYRGPISSSSSYLPSMTTTTGLLLSRLFLYICICLFRMCILYLLLNHLEDNYSTAASWVSSTSSSSSSCWYQPYLQQRSASLISSNDTNSYCSHRRAFDFSDHMVLYYGQILPIATAETLSTITTTTATMMMTTMNHDHHRQRRRSCSTGVVVLLAAATFLYLLYLHAIVNRAAYGTAAYFHTSAEVYAGYLIGLLCVTWPLAHMQCHGWYPFAGPQPHHPSTTTFTTITDH